MPISLKSADSIGNIDELLGIAGLRHGRRKLIPAQFERQSRHPRQLAAARRTTARPAKSRIEVLRSPLLAEFSWLLSGFSTRSGGSSDIYSPGQPTGELNLVFTEADTRQNVLENRSRFFKELTGEADFPMVTLRQIHSSLMRRVDGKDAAETARWRGDGLMTAEPGLLL